jgi:hypothetical protein
MPRPTHTLGLALLLPLAGAAACTSPAGGAAVRTRGAPTVADVRVDAAAQPVPRQIVRRGDMNVEVRDVAPARARLAHAAGVLGAQVARVETEQDERATYELRVPGDRLDALMDSVAALGAVKRRTASAQDVTDVVIDAEARLTSLRASRDRLRQLLDRAASVPDVITVERELARVQGDIESLEGRLAALRGQVAMSELSVELRRKVVLGPLGAFFKAIGTAIGKLFVVR